MITMPATTSPDMHSALGIPRVLVVVSSSMAHSDRQLIGRSVTPAEQQIVSRPLAYSWQ
jgi:hypothetical protein